MNEKVMVGVITALAINTAAVIWQAFFIIKTLDTDPPIVERIIALEYYNSEHGRVNQKILERLESIDRLITKFGNEQSRRKPLVDYIERKINGR